MKTKTTKQNRINSHVNALVARYGALTVAPATFFRIARRCECRLNRIAVAACEGHISERRQDNAELAALARIVKCFAAPEFIARELWVNSDPRGYSLKLHGDFKHSDITTDWGGYGILAPEF